VEIHSTELRRSSAYAKASADTMPAPCSACPLKELSEQKQLLFRMYAKLTFPISANDLNTRGNLGYNGFEIPNNYLLEK
jgi:hypothetical protein